MNYQDKELDELFKLANKIGNRRYHKLTEQDFENYRAFDRWRYVNGDGECGTTQESRDWVKENSDWHCPICEEHYSKRGGKSIDHKLPRSQYPWLSMDFKNLWVICLTCNQEKSEMHWYEYEQYIFVNYPDLYLSVRSARPKQLLEALKN